MQNLMDKQKFDILMKLVSIPTQLLAMAGLLRVNNLM